MMKIRKESLRLSTLCSIAKMSSSRLSLSQSRKVSRISTLTLTIEPSATVKTNSQLFQPSYRRITTLVEIQI